MKVLVINAGSSSLKYQLIDMDNESVIAKGLCERIGIEGSKLTHKVPGKEDYVIEEAMPSHKKAIELVLKALVDPEHGVVASADEIDAIGHRVLHGGSTYTESIKVDEDVKRVIRECFDLGPLHNPANLMGIEACEAAMPGKPNVVPRHEPQLRISRDDQVREPSGGSSESYRLPPRQRLLDLRICRRKGCRHIDGTDTSRGRRHGNPLRFHRSGCCSVPLRS